MPINPLQLPGPLVVPQVDFTPLSRIGQMIGEQRGQEREAQAIGDYARSLSGQPQPTQQPSGQPVLGLTPGQQTQVAGIPGQQPPGGQLPRGLRNNNPGNIEDGPLARSLPGYAGTDGRFARFDTPDNGLNAMDALLTSYGRRGLKTVRDVISRWAPSSDGNPVDAYAAYAGNGNPDAPVDLSNPEQRKALALRMAQFENGMAPPGAMQQPGPQTSRGLPPGEAERIARLAQAGPEGRKLASALLAKYGQQPTFELKEIGTDRNGNKQYGVFNPLTGAVSPYTPTGAQAQQQGQGGDMPTGDAFLRTLETGRANQIKAIVEGRMAPPGGFALKSPQIQALMRDAAQYEPGFDLNIWTQRNATTKDFASGKSAQNVTSLNTVIGHLGDLMEKAKALDNYRIPIFNTVANTVSQATGDKRVAEYKLAAKAVADEMARVFRQVGMSDTEIRQWHSALSADMSPEQQRGVISTAVGLLDSRLQALGDQRNRGFSTRVEPRSLLNESAQKKLQAIEQWASGQQPQQQGGPPRFGTPEFATLPSGQPYIAPDGSIRTKR